MLRIDYKCISQLMLILLAACVVLMRKERSEGAVLVVYALLFVIIFIYLAATPRAAGIWLMIIRVRIRSLSHPESFSHCLWSSTPLYSLHFQHALPNQILVRSFKLAYSPKVKILFSLLCQSLFFLLTPQRVCVGRRCCGCTVCNVNFISQWNLIQQFDCYSSLHQGLTASALM